MGREESNSGHLWGARAPQIETLGEASSEHRFSRYFPPESGRSLPRAARLRRGTQSPSSAFLLVSVTVGLPHDGLDSLCMYASPYLCTAHAPEAPCLVVYREKPPGGTLFKIFFYRTRVFAPFPTVTRVLLCIMLPTSVAQRQNIQVGQHNDQSDVVERRRRGA